MTALKWAYGNDFHLRVAFSVRWVCVGGMWTHCACVQGSVRWEDPGGLSWGGGRADSGAAGKLVSAIRYCSLVTNLKWNMTEMEFMAWGGFLRRSGRAACVLPTHTIHCLSSRPNPATSSVISGSSGDPLLARQSILFSESGEERTLFGNKKNNVLIP